MTTSQRKHRRRNEKEWRSLLGEQQESGLSQRLFCQQRGLTLSTFRNWKQRLSSNVPVSPSESADWIELPLGPVQSTNVSWDIELDLGNGLCLRLRQR